MSTFDPTPYYQQILDAMRKRDSSGFGSLSNADKNKVYDESNNARNILSQNGIDTSNGYWASGTPYTTALQGFTQDQLKGQVNNMYDQMQQSRLDQLRASQQDATNRLNQQKAEYGQQIQGQKNQADVTSVQNAQKLREIMAANGLTGTGENVTATVANQSARQNALNALDQQQNNYNRDINNQIASVNNPAQEQAMLADLSAQRAQALLNAQQTAYNQAMGQAQFNQNQQNWQSQFDFNKQQAQQSQEWQKYVYDHLSASDKAQLDWAQKQFGEQMGWNYWSAQNQNAVAQATAQAQIDAMQQMLNGMGGNFPNNGGGGGAPSNLQGIINKSAQQFKLNPQLLSAVIKTESGFNANAKSPAGAIGLMQLMPGTAQGLGVNPYDPTENVLGGSEYLSNQMKKYGDVKLALAAYNAGPGRVDSAIKKAGSRAFSDISKYLPSETRNYVNKVLSNL